MEIDELMVNLEETLCQLKNDTQLELAAKYREGNGVAQNMKEAVRLTKEVAEQGHPGAQQDLGQYYQYGMGVQKDMKEAVRWWTKAAEQDNAVSQFKLGVCYVTGEGVSIDLKEGKKWLTKAADQGFEEAKKLLSMLQKK